MPSVPPAPPRFSTTIGWPSVALSGSNNARGTMSVALPAAKWDENPNGLRRPGLCQRRIGAETDGRDDDPGIPAGFHFLIPLSLAPGTSRMATSCHLGKRQMTGQMTGIDRTWPSFAIQLCAVELRPRFGILS